MFEWCDVLFIRVVIGGRCLSGVCCMCVLRTECVIVASAVLIAVEGFVSDCLELLQSASHPLS